MPNGRAGRRETKSAQALQGERIRPPIINAARLDWRSHIDKIHVCAEVKECRALPARVSVRDKRARGDSLLWRGECLQGIGAPFGVGIQDGAHCRVVEGRNDGHRAAADGHTKNAVYRAIGHETNNQNENATRVC